MVACPPGYPAAELDEIRRLLRPQDRLLRFDHHHDMGLCAAAAEAARGEVLFFTESHCLPEPETLARADTAAAVNPEWAGFSCQSVPITHNLLSRVEAEWYGRDIQFGALEHPWRKVLDQCFVVRSSAYFQAGGFDAAFGHFAEWLLAARFHAQGLTIGYTPVCANPPCVHRAVRRVASVHGRLHRGADEVSRARAGRSDPDDVRRVPEWSGRHNLQRDVARRICRMLLLDLRVRSWSRAW